MKKLIAWLLLLTLTVGLFAGCKPAEGNPTEPDVTVSQADIEGINAAIDYLKGFYKDDGSETPVDYERFGIVRIGGVPYTVVWTVDVSEDLIKIVVNDDGTVTIDVNENCEEDTPYVLTATVTDAEGNTATHSWKHILPKAVDMVSIVKLAYALQPGESLPYESTLRGKITQIKSPWSDEYKNITVVIEVEGAEDMPIECYRLKGEGAEDLAVGDIITVTGTLKNYNGTIEFDSGCVLVAVTAGERVEAPDDMKQIVDEAYALGANKTLPYEATLTGTITAVKTPYDEYYGNVSVEFVVEGREDYPILAYRMKGDGIDQIGVNDVITVKGYITNYVGSAGYSTIEYTAGCQLISWEDYAAPEAPSDPKQIVDEAYALGANKSLKYEATLTGKITKVKYAYDPNYGNITVEMVVEGRENKPILCYRMKGSGVENLDIGDVITVKGYIKNYVGDAGYSTIEFDYPTLVSYTKNSVKAPSDPVQIVKDAYALAAGEQLPYKATLTGVITEVNDAYDAGYGNVTVTMVVTGAEDMPIKCYRMKGTGAELIGEGDTITVSGYITKYQHSSGDTEVEFESGCKLESWQDTGAGGNEPTVPPTTMAPTDISLESGDKVVIFAPAYNMALSADKVDETSYYNKGVEVSVSGGVVSGYTDKEVWTVTLNSDGTYVFANGGKNLGMADEFSSLNLGEVNDDWIVIPLGDGLYLIRNVVRSNYIEWYASKSNWSSYNSKYAATDDQFQLSIYVVGEGLLDDEAVELPEPETTVPPTTVPPTTNAEGMLEVIEMVEDPVVGTPYKLYSVQQTLAKTLYITGETANAEYYMATTEDMNAGIDVYLEAAEGGYYLYFNKSGVKTYIDLYVSETGYQNIRLVSAPGVVYTYNTEYNTLVAPVGEDDCYIGTYRSYNTFSCSKLTYASSSFPSHLGVIVEKLPSETEPPMTVPPTTEAPETEPPVTTEPADISLETGDQVVIFAPAYNMALSADKVTEGSYYNKGVEVSVSGGVVSGYGDAEIWTATKNADGSYSFANGGQNIGLAESYSSMNLGAVNDDWYVVSLGDGLYLIRNVVRGNYIEWYADKSNWSSYDSSYAATDDQFQLSLYVIGKGLLEDEAVEIPETTVPETTEPEATVPPTTLEPGTMVEVLKPVAAPEAGKAYKFVIQQNNLDGDPMLGLTGEMNGYYYASTTSNDEMVDVYLEAVSGGYHVYFLNGTTKTYLDIIPRATDATKANVVFQTSGEHSAYTLNTEYKYIYTTVNEVQWYIGTYGTYNTFSPSKVEYIADTSTIGTSNFPAWFYELVEEEYVPPVTEETTVPETTVPEVEETTEGEVEVTTAPEAEGSSVSISFADTSTRVSQDANSQVWAQNGITVTNNKGNSTSDVPDRSNPARFYKNSELIIAYPGMTKIVVDSVTYDDNDYAGPLVTAIEALGDSNVTATVADGDVTIVFAQPVDSLTVALTAGQVRAYEITVYTGEAGEQETTDPEVEETTVPETTEAPTEAETTVPEDTVPETTEAPTEEDSAEYVVIYSVSGGKVATTTNQPYNSKDQLVMADATLNGGVITTDAADVLLVTIINNDDNTVSFKTADGKYLHADATNVNLVDAENDNTKFVLEEADGGYYIKLANATYSGRAQYLEYYYEKLTCYGMSTSNPSIYVFQFYPVAEPEVEETTVPETTEAEIEETTTEEVVETTEAEVEETTAPAGEIKEYKMAMNKNGTMLYFNGSTESASVTYRLATTENEAEAVSVFLEETTGGYYLWFMSGDVKTYIRLYERTDGTAGSGSGSVALVTEKPAELLTMDETTGTLFYVADADNSYYLGTYSTYTTFSANNSKYITGSNAGNVDVSQYPAHFYEVTGEEVETTTEGETEETTVPEVEETTVPETTEAPTEAETTVPEVTEPETEAPTEAETEPEVEETTVPESTDVVYKKITTAGEFTSGSYVMVVGSGYAPGAVDGTWLSAIQPTVVDGQIVNPDAGVWSLTVTDSTVTMQDANGVFVAPKSGNNANNGIVTSTTSGYGWTWSVEDGAFTFSGTGSDTNILVSYKNSENKFRSLKYSTATGSNASQYYTTFTLYKLVEDPDITPEMPV